MDEKDLINEPNDEIKEIPVDEVNTDVQQENEILDEGLEEKDGVKYETNDNWEFDAKAPTTLDDFAIENENFEIPINDSKSKNSTNAKSKNQGKPQTTGNENVIVINKEPLKFIPLAIFVAAVIAVLAVLGVRYYTVPNGKEGNMMNPGSVVATVDDTKVSVGMFNYYYSSIVSYYESYAAYGYFDLDTSSDYSTQFTTDDDGNTISWEEFFKNTALNEIESITVYYNEGVKEGVTLTATQKETIESQIDTLKDSASEAEVSLDDYISANFGEYCTEDTIRLMFEQYYIAANYKGKFAADTQFTDEEINTYFDEHKDDFNEIEFSYLAIEYDSTDDTTIKASKSKAEEYMEKMTDEASVETLAAEVYKDYIESDAQSAMESDDTLSEEDAIEQATESYVSNTTASITGSDSPFDDETTQWWFSDDTPIGSTNYYIDESSGYIYILLKTNNAELLDSDTYSVRHILITPESDEDSTDSSTDSSDESEYTDEQWAAAKEKAESILKEYTDGEQTEYNFALLAEENSTDTASTSSGSSDSFGGIYEGITTGQMVAEFQDWAMDSSRKYGDTGIVKSDYGYHIMFFISSGPEYKADIISALREEKFDDMISNSNVKLRNSTIDNAIASYNEKSQNTDDE